ncbi:MAG: ATP-binding protein [Prolixibacteraceae bacterium]
MPNKELTNKINQLEQEVANLKVTIDRMAIDKVANGSDLVESEARIRAFFYENNSIILIINPDGGEIIDANPTACKYYGYEYKVICGMNIAEINVLSKEEVLAEMKSAKEQKRKHFYFRHRLANNEIRDVEVYSGPVQFGETKLLYSIIHDISDRKQTEDSIIRANRLFAVISQVNQAIVRIKDRKQLFEEICQVTVEHGKFQLAWIGFVDEGTGIVKPVVFKGHEDGYLSEIKPVRLTEEPEGQGPTGRSLREGKYFVCNDIANDPNMLPWREKALARGYRSSIGLPIMQFGKVTGSFTLYATVPFFFNEEEINLLVGVSNDISYALDTLEMENEIRELNATLEQKIEQRTAQLSQTNDELQKEIGERMKAEGEIIKARNEAEQANLAKSEFLSRMSHELRTPLNSILGFAQLLGMGDLDVRQTKGINRILQSGKHLLDLINEVLDISRIEAGRLSLSIEQVQLCGIIEETKDIVMPQAAERQINVELQNSPTNKCFVKSDKQRLKQILLNLITNAVKYNRKGGSVVISTVRMPPDNQGIEYIRISITDTGDGIEQGDLPKLFRPFERIGAEQTPTEGSGLGLAVVKKLVEAMAGKLGVESKKGEGSTFWFEMPSSESQLNIISQSGNFPPLEPGLENKAGVILYIEDNQSNIELIEQVLLMQRSGIQLITDIYGKETLKLAIEYRPDLILLDLNLPDIHGLDVLRSLKANEITNSIPVVIISADAMPKTIEELLNEGAKRFLTKPIDVKELLEVIDKYVVSQLDR